MGISTWRKQWKSLERVLLSRGATGRWAEGLDKPPRFDVDPPATEDEVRAIESKLDQPIPPSLRRVIRRFSSRVCIEWALPEEIRPPKVFREVWAGECRWDLKTLPALQKKHREWIEGCFTGKQPDDWEKSPKEIKYDLIWHQKFAFLEISDGDMLGIDIAVPKQQKQPVIYLSHEGGSRHGYHLGDDFEDYVDRLTALAFVGTEECQLTPFLLSRKSGLQTQSRKAAIWRRWLGIPEVADGEGAIPPQKRTPS